MLKAIRKAGLDKDPVFSVMDKAAWKRLLPSTRRWIKSRYRRTCAACGKTAWTSPGTLPVCFKCWPKLPGEVRAWWWASKRTQKGLQKLLDAYFGGGYEVAADPRQLSTWKDYL